MPAVEVILLQRVEKLGQMGEVVKVKPGYARNYLLPEKKALRANKENRERFESQRVQLEAQNLRRREESRARRGARGWPHGRRHPPGRATRAASTAPCRRATSPEATTAAGLTVYASAGRAGPAHQVARPQPRARPWLHPEVSIPVTVNVARSPEDAERQARGERGGETAPEEAEVDATALFEPGAEPSSTGS